MYRWCAYCQQFLGEVEPFNDYQPTHGICLVCKAKFNTDEEQLVSRARPIIVFFKELRKNLLERTNATAPEIIKEGAKLGIAPVDLLAGIMQPLLYEISQLQAAGKATIRHEHDFSTLVESVLVEIRNENGQNFNNLKSKSDVLLACADGNYHVFGVRIIAEYLLKENVSCQSLFPSLPFDEILIAAKEIEAKVIGISVVTLEQTMQVLENWKSYTKSTATDNRLSLVLGGHGVSTIEALPPHTYAHVGSLLDFKKLIQSLI